MPALKILKIYSCRDAKTSWAKLSSQPVNLPGAQPLMKLLAKWPMEPALISGFCSVKQMRVFDSSWTGLIHHRLAPSGHWYSFTYPGRMESWVILDGKKSRTNQFKPWQSQGLNWGPCGRKAEILSKTRNQINKPVYQKPGLIPFFYDCVKLGDSYSIQRQ